MTNYIYITTQFEGFHRYPDAPDEVAFLRERHRHIFHIKFFIEVEHDDRSIEFFMFKKQVETLIENSELDNSSCEVIANYLHSKIKLVYPGRKMKIDVSEDLENGCLTEYEE